MLLSSITHLDDVTLIKNLSRKRMISDSRTEYGIGTSHELPGCNEIVRYRNQQGIIRTCQGFLLKR
jgi:hypothetical protein